MGGMGKQYTCAYICMVCLLEDMWEVSGTVCKQARSATVSAQHSSKSNSIKMGSGFQTSELEFFANILLLLVGRDLKTLCGWIGGGGGKSAECFIVPL